MIGRPLYFDFTGEPPDPDWIVDGLLERGTDRPATTVNGDPRISAPGHHDPRESGSQQRDAVRVTTSEASVLQGFPADYPWQGSRTAQFRQIGNAVPPPLAKAILAALLASRPGVSCV